MFFRRSPRRRRSSRIGSFVNYARARWAHTDVDRAFNFKRGYSRRLNVEALEDRNLLAVFTNPAAILIPAGQPGITNGIAAPYPSTIAVPTAATIVDVNVTLHGLTHTFPDDIDILLVGPTGANAIILSDVGSDANVANLEITLDDQAPTALPDSTILSSGTFQPTNSGGGDSFAAPAPAPAGGSALSVFNGTPANGNWNLFVVDDQTVDFGALSGGWSLEITFVAGPVVDAGGAQNNGVPDVFEIRRTGAGGATLEIERNGVVVFTAPYNTVPNIQINGSNDDDLLIVDSSGGLIGVPDGIRFNGGQGLDSTRFEQPTSGTVHFSATYSLDVAPGSGSHVIVGAGETQNLTFVNAESALDLTPTTAFVVNATPEANAINYSQGSAPTIGRVTVDNYPPVEFTAKMALTINGLAGSDEINLNNPSNPTGLTFINVNAGDPVGNSDVVIVADIDSTTAITVSNIGADSATVVGAQAAIVNVTGAEVLVIDGQGGNDQLEVQGAAGSAERFVHTPGNAPDAGRFEIVDEATNTTLLPIAYSDLGLNGSVNVNGQGQPAGASDTLVARGTEGADTMNVAFAAAGQPRVDLTTTLGVHIDLDGTAVENLVVEMLGDNDRIVVAAPITLNGGTFTVIGGDSDATTDEFIINGQAATAETVTIAPDATITSHQDVTVNGNRTDVSGVELIRYTGAGGDDSLAVELGFGAATARVENSAIAQTDQVISSVLPIVQFTAVNAFTLDGSFDPTTATFALADLEGATTYTFDSDDPQDTLVIEGTGGGETITVSMNGANVRIASGRTLETTGMTATDLLKINSLGGNDSIVVNVNTTGLVPTPIVVDGGAGSDNLTVQGTPTTAITTVNYTPGLQPDEGRLVYNATAMDISFDNLETLADTTTADALTVNGTPADNAISYTVGPNTAAPPNATGEVSIDNFVPIEFRNKTTLTINGNEGSDLISLNNSSPTNPQSLTSITVNGGDPTAGSDTVVVTDVDNATAIVVSAIGADSATVTGAQLAPVAVTGAELLIIDGQGGNGAGDQLQVQGGANAERFVHKPGTAPDRGRFEIIDETAARTLLPVEYVDLGLNGTVTVNAQGGADTLVARGTEGADTMNVAFAAAGQPRVDLTTTLGVHIDLDGTAVENLVVETLGDNDRIVVAAPITLNGGTFTVIGGDSDATTDEFVVNGQAATAETVTIAPDATIASHQDVTVNGNRTDVSGVEVIRYNGSPSPVVADDDLTVLPGGNNDVSRLDGGNIFDKLVSNTLPEVQFTDVNSFTLSNQLGIDEMTINLSLLEGAASYNVISSESDSVIFEGAGNIDLWTVVKPVADELTVTDNSSDHSGASVTIKENGVDTQDVQFRTLGGNDVLTVNVTGGLITLPMTFDGGANSDTLVVLGTPPAGTPVSTVTYTPGLQVDEGRIVYAATGATMDISFDNLEPVIDLVVAGLLVVSGTPDADEINYTSGANSGVVNAVLNPLGVATGQISVNGFETYEFSNKVLVRADALAGDDTVVVNLPTGAAAPLGLTEARVNAGEGNDTVRFESLPATGGGSVFLRGRVNGNAGNDILDASLLTNSTPVIMFGQTGNDTITGGPGADTINGEENDDTIVDSRGNDIYNGGTGIDTFLIRGTAAADVIAYSLLLPTATNGDNYDVLVYNAPLTLPAAVTDQDEIVSINTAISPQAAANRPSIENVRIEGLAGDDVFQVSQADVYTDTSGANGIPEQTIPVHVVGGSPNASDRLVVLDEGAGDLVIHREGPDGRSGSVVVGSFRVNANAAHRFAAPVSYEETERVDITPLDDLGRTGTGAPPAGRLLVFKNDDFEANESMTNATPLGLLPVFIGQRNIDPGKETIDLPPPLADIVRPGDEDWYEFRPTKASTFRFEILFEHIGQLANGRPGLPNNGNLQLDVFRANGVLIDSSDISAATSINVDTSEVVEFGLDPDITQSVFIRVRGLEDATDSAINNYDILVTDIDDEGPRVFDPDGPVAAIFPNNLEDFDLFASKFNDPDEPAVLIPTPLIFSLTVNIEDLPNPGAPGDPIPALDPDSAEQPGIYQVVGDHVGIVDIRDVEVRHNFQFENVTVSQQVSATTFGSAEFFTQTELPIVGDFIQFTSGLNAGQVRTITAINTANQQITVNAALPNVPAVGDDFIVTSSREAQVVLHFAQPLPDDRFTLTILDSITDPAGNLFDGESDAAEPADPFFPSGNGVPGGIFVARFTVDSRPEIGTAVALDIDIDINGNFVWDPANGQIGNDHTNVDITFTLPVQNGVGGPITAGGFNVNDLLVAGKFFTTGTPPSQLFDQLGAFGVSAELAGSPHRWLIDTNGDGVVTINGTGDRLITQGNIAGFTVAGSIPIAGNFAPGHAGDEIGLYNAGNWAVDTTGDFIIDTVIAGNMLGIPIVGDFDGNGSDDFAVFNTNQFRFDFQRNGVADGSPIVWGFPGVLDRPIAADMDQDGQDDVGLWVPRNSASLPQGVGEWYFMVSGGALGEVTTVTSPTVFRSATLIGSETVAVGQQVRIRSGANAGVVRTVTQFNSATGQVTLNAAVTLELGDTIAIGGTLNHAFTPVPFGSDISAEFGDELALPIVGNFDPPAAPTIIAPATGAEGDFDNSGDVDDGDYNVWSANYGSPGNAMNAGTSNTFDITGFVLWAANNTGSAGGASTMSVMESDDSGEVSEEAAAAESDSVSESASEDASEDASENASENASESDSESASEPVAAYVVAITTVAEVESFAEVAFEEVAFEEVAQPAQVTLVTTSTSEAVSTSPLAIDGFFATLDRSTTATAKVTTAFDGSVEAKNDDLLLTALAEPAVRLDDRGFDDGDDFASFSKSDDESLDEYLDDLAVLDEVFQTI